MTVKTRTTKGKCKARIEGELTIYTVAIDKEKLLKPLAKCQSVGLDLSGVTEFDTAGFQLLMLLKRDARHADIDLRVERSSTTVQDVLDIYGVTDQLDAVGEYDVSYGSSGATSL